jgi:hypothetical protein
MIINQAYTNLLSDFISIADDILGEHRLAIYLMGSLARGGFSESVSDIDLGIIVYKIDSTTETYIADIVSLVKQKHPTINNKISVFWGTIDSINKSSDSGRYPPFDRLDLIDHAQLIKGKEIRNQLIKPSQIELEMGCCEFALQYLSSPARLAMFNHGSSLLNQGTTPLTKAILFPARFIYLARSNQLSTNEASAQYYVNNFSGNDALLVEKGYEWRMGNMPESQDQIITLIDNGILSLYNNFLDIYITKQYFYNNTELAKKLVYLKRKINLVSPD